MKNIALLYSGGYDSLLAACAVSKKYGFVHLLTCKMLGIFNLNAVKININKLIEKNASTRYIHKILNIKKIQKQLLSGYTDKCKKYRGEFPPIGIWCGTCQLSMKTAALIYCLAYRVPVCADAVVRTQYYHTSHRVGFINRVKKLYAEYGIRYINPIYEFEGNKREYLIKEGFITGTEFLEVSRTIQPFCLASVLSLTEQISNHVPDSVIEGFVESMLPVMRKIVDDYVRDNRLAKKGIVLEEKEFIRLNSGNEKVSGSKKKKVALIKKVLAPVYLLIEVVIYLFSLKNRITKTEEWSRGER